MHIDTNNEKIDISSEKLLEELAAKVFKNIKLGDIIFLIGEMGVGKTTFVKYLVNEFQKQNKLKRAFCVAFKCEVFISIKSKKSSYIEAYSF